MIQMSKCVVLSQISSSQRRSFISTSVFLCFRCLFKDSINNVKNRNIMIQNWLLSSKSHDTVEEELTPFSPIVFFSSSFFDFFLSVGHTVGLDSFNLSLSDLALCD